ncbi:MAG: HupE/UreJ family protein [Croceibacterium sp.]
MLLVRRIFVLFALWPALLLAVPAAAHPVPYSYLDLELADGGLTGKVTVHDADAAFVLGLADPAVLRDPAQAKAQFGRLSAWLAPHIQLPQGEAIRWQSITPATDDDALILRFGVEGPPPARFPFRAHLFDHDPQHQTFVNVYEQGSLRQQWIFGPDSEARTYYRGTTAGAVEVMKTFIPSGACHILIGPDHLLFLFALLLLGGIWRQLAVVVTAFTVGHSITLSLAALDIVNPPAFFIEPAIALTIVVVGADNLLRGEGKDLRPWVAGLFGLIHGFGFANVLKEFGLPQEALGWSLFSFNVGVELGQLFVVLLVAALLAAIRRRWPTSGKAIVTGGSLVVIAAGLYWFVERTMGIPGGN